jgi:hypothetical protein
MAENGSDVEALESAERDQQILQLKLSGVSTKQIGKRFHLSDRAVASALDRVLPQLDSVERARYWKASVATLDMLQSWWTAEAKSSPAACTLLLKILEQRSMLLGIQAPVKLDLQLAASAEPTQTSTQLLVAALDRIAAEGSPGGLQPADVEAEQPPEPPA